LAGAELGRRGGPDVRVAPRCAGALELSLGGRWAVEHRGRGAAGLTPGRGATGDVLWRFRPDGDRIAIDGTTGATLAGVGRVEEGRTQLDELLARHAKAQGPLAGSYLHSDRARLALDERDFDACRKHLDASEMLARELNMPSVIAKVRDLGYQIRLAQSPVQSDGRGPLRAEDEHVELRTQMTLRSVGAERADLQSEIVRIAQHLTEASVGFFVPGSDESESIVGNASDPQDPTAIHWARERLGTQEGEDDTTDASTGDELHDPNALRVGDVHYCLCPFWTAVDGEPRPLGALVLGFRDGAPRVPAPDVLNVMLESLTDQALGGKSMPASLARG